MKKIIEGAQVQMLTGLNQESGLMNAKYVPVTVMEHSKTERTKLNIFP